MKELCQQTGKGGRLTFSKTVCVCLLPAGLLIMRGQKRNMPGMKGRCFETHLGWQIGPNIAFESTTYEPLFGRGTHFLAYLKEPHRASFVQRLEKPNVDSFVFILPDVKHFLNVISEREMEEKSAMPITPFDVWTNNSRGISSRECQKNWNYLRRTETGSHVKVLHKTSE